MSSGSILVVNAGASSLRFSLFCVADADDMRGAVRTQVDGIGSRPHRKTKDDRGKILVERDLAAAAVSAGKDAITLAAACLLARGAGFFSNINLAPVPFLSEFKPGVKSFEDIIYSYRRGPKYSENKFIPEKIAAFGSTGMVRELTTGRLDIYPFQYNPVSRVMKVYTRVRVRVSFGTAPVLYNYPRSREEIALLKDAALNSDLALNWLNPKLKNVFRQNLVVPSVMATGDWYKIKIEDPGDNGEANGMYKITRSWLEAAGINLSGIDPRKIKLFGNGGFILPEDLNANGPGALH